MELHAVIFHTKVRIVIYKINWLEREKPVQANFD